MNTWNQTDIDALVDQLHHDVPHLTIVKEAALPFDHNHDTNHDTTHDTDHDDHDNCGRWDPAAQAATAAEDPTAADPATDRGDAVHTDDADLESGHLTYGRLIIADTRSGHEYVIELHDDGIALHVTRLP